MKIANGYGLQILVHVTNFRNSFYILIISIQLENDVLEKINTPFQSNITAFNSLHAELYIISSFVHILWTILFDNCTIYPAPA